MKSDFLFKPTKNLYLRIIMFIIALVLFVWSGLLFAAASTGQGAEGSWKIALPALIAGGLLLAKARSPKP